MSAVASKHVLKVLRYSPNGGTCGFVTQRVCHDKDQQSGSTFGCIAATSNSPPLPVVADMFLIDTQLHVCWEVIFILSQVGMWNGDNRQQTGNLLWARLSVPDFGLNLVSW